MINGNKEILYIIDSVAREKNISVDDVVEAMESGIKTAAKKKYGHDLLIECKLNRKTGLISIFDKLKIVENKKENFNSKKEITLKDVKAGIKSGKFSFDSDKEPEVGDFVTIQLPNIDLERIIVQIARNEIIKKIKDAEKEKEYNEFINRVGTIINGTVKKIGMKNIVVEVDGYEALLADKEMIPGERFRTNDRIRAYIKEVIKDQKGAQVFLSRTDNNFLAELFKQEVPEIFDGVVEIKGVARDPGSKAKISVFSKNNNLDPVGACVGIRGTRVQNITNELKGEKIDVIKYSENIIDYIINSITPAKPLKVIYHEDESFANIVLTKDQLSLAIGRAGQNVKLASKITGIKIEVITEEEEKERKVKEFKELSNNLIESLDIEEIVAQLLISSGFSTIESIADATIEDLNSIQGFDENLSNEIKNRAIEFLSNKK